MGNRVHYVENKMGKCTETMNDLVDAYEENKADKDLIRAKLADLEDRSRRNNVKLRGVLEFVPHQDLLTYSHNLTSAILPEASPMDLTINRIHHFPKASHFADSVPRDMLMRVHFFQTKEQLLSTARSMCSLPAPYTDLQIFPDLSKHTLQL